MTTRQGCGLSNIFKYMLLVTGVTLSLDMPSTSTEDNYSEPDEDTLHLICTWCIRAVLHKWLSTMWMTTLSLKEDGDTLHQIWTWCIVSSLIRGRVQGGRRWRVLLVALSQMSIYKTGCSRWRHSPQYTADNSGKWEACVTPDSSGMINYKKYSNPEKFQYFFYVYL